MASRLRDDVPLRLVLRKEDTKAASYRFVAEVTETLKGGAVLRAEERAEDLYAAINTFRHPFPSDSSLQDRSFKTTD